jgi:HlyD family secretion protein
MNKWLKRLLVVALLVAIVVALKLTVFKPEPIEVDIQQVSRGLVEETVTNSRAGTVKAHRRAKLSPEYGGMVVELPYREGDRVDAGDMLLRLDDSLQRARLRLAEEDLQASRAERQRACLAAERASRELERTERLAQENIVSADLLDGIDSGKREADAACAAAAAAVERAAAAVAVARTEVEKTVVRAPFAGVVAEVATEVGEWTTPSPPALPVPPVIDVLDPDSIYISAPMDEVDSARIQAGQPTRVTVDSHRDRSFDGTVTRVAPYVLDIEAQNRTVEIEVALEDTAETVLLPGTSADVEVILSTRQDVLRISTSSLIEGGKVLTLEGDRLVEREVELGLRNWDFTEILDGLSEGDLVVTSLDRQEVEDGALATAATEDPE